ncbi:MAG: hypothetical protein ACYS7Y_36310 [Planctomycetota bacterium]|jgi:hypothetical protein
MAAITGALIGGGLALAGAKKAKKAADADRAQSQEVMDRLAQVQFNPFSTSGFGGAGGLAGGQAAQLAAMGQFPGAAFGQLGALGQQAFGRAQDIGAGGFQRVLQNQLFGRAGELAGQTDFTGLRDQTLGTLRQQAAPFEERAFGGLQENLFATGRLGSSGGALQTEAFARGLGEADLSRQLQATQVAQTQQAQNAALARQFGGMGAGLAGLEDKMLGSAFQRFGGTAGLGADLQRQLFGQGSTIFAQGLQGLAGQQSIMDSILGLGTFGANLGAQRASTDIAAAGGQAQVMAQQGPSGGDLTGAFLSQAGQGIAGGGANGLFNSIGGFFGGGGGGGSIDPNSPNFDIDAFIGN